MTMLEKIEQDITQLTADDLRKLSEWLVEYREEMWDRQIEADAKAGKFDRKIAEAKAQVAAGRVRDL